MAALEQATDILLVSSLDVTSIRSLRKAVEAMDAIGITKTRHFVLNRADAKVGLRPVDAAEAVGLPIEAMIDSAREIPLSMNVGTPVVKLEPRSAVAKQMSQLTHLFAAMDVDTPQAQVVPEGTMSLSERIELAQSASATVTALRRPHDRGRSGRVQGRRLEHACSSAWVSDSSRRRTLTVCGRRWWPRSAPSWTPKRRPSPTPSGSGWSARSHVT